MPPGLTVLKSKHDFVSHVDRLSKPGNPGFRSLSNLLTVSVLVENNRSLGGKGRAQKRRALSRSTGAQILGCHLRASTLPLIRLEQERQGEKMTTSPSPVPNHVTTEDRTKDEGYRLIHAHIIRQAACLCPHSSRSGKKVFNPQRELSSFHESFHRERPDNKSECSEI
ncbi:hypothetical protein AVEN_203729-1 [Araneus ventricosus]|uniref:Uncharacterized protein n=1 Tax=Araneus ventricosus TaxID=182803 RepID=A0A4Y2ISK9_ARAVE|nr:hypothetical protein AVEN_203729-1 [Araneus ventricosus]